MSLHSCRKLTVLRCYLNTKIEYAWTWVISSFSLRLIVGLKAVNYGVKEPPVKLSTSRICNFPQKICIRKPSLLAIDLRLRFEWPRTAAEFLGRHLMLKFSLCVGSWGHLFLFARRLNVWYVGSLPFVQKVKFQCSGVIISNQSACVCCTKLYPYVIW